MPLRGSQFLQDLPEHSYRDICCDVSFQKHREKYLYVSDSNGRCASFANSMHIHVERSVAQDTGLEFLACACHVILCRAFAESQALRVACQFQDDLGDRGGFQEVRAGMKELRRPLLCFRLLLASPSCPVLTEHPVAATSWLSMAVIQA